MKIGDLVRHSTSIGVVVRKLQYDEAADNGVNWDGEPAWWVQFTDDDTPTWAYEEELTPVTKGTHLSLGEVSLLPVTNGN